MVGPYHYLPRSHASHSQSSQYHPSRKTVSRHTTPPGNPPSSSSDDDVLIGGVLIKRWQVLEYLNKKGYSKTEATLRREVADRDTGPVVRKVQDKGWEKYTESYSKFDTAFASRVEWSLMVD
jgi:hypothetical protein